MDRKRRKCSGEGVSAQILRPMSVPQCENSYPSVTSQVVGKMLKFSAFSGDPTKKGEVSLEQSIFKVKGVMQSHTEVTLREGMVWSLHRLCRAAAELVWYLGLQALVSEIINKLELLYGTMASFDILMQNFYKLQQGKAEKVTMYVTWLEGALNVVQQEYLTMLSTNEVQHHLRDRLFHGLCK